MSDDTNGTAPDPSPETSAAARIAFKDGLRTAIEKEIVGPARMAINHFFAYGLGRKTPPEFAGNGDRSAGFYWATTILKTFGEQEGVAYLLRIHPYHPELEDGVRAVFNKELRDIDRAAAERLARHRLVTRCGDCRDAIKEVLSYEGNHILQHSLTALQGELAWCARELNPEGQHEA